MSPLRFLLRFIGAGQLFFGALFTLAPTQAASWFGLHPTAPGWANWLFFMLGARFLGYGAGMLVAARDPQAHVAWLNTMAAVQVLDWAATLAYLAAGDIAFAHVAPAVVLPVIWVAGLIIWHPSRRTTAA